MSLYVNASCKNMHPVKTTTPTTVDPARNALYFSTAKSLGNLRFATVVVAEPDACSAAFFVVVEKAFWIALLSTVGRVDDRGESVDR